MEHSYLAQGTITLPVSIKVKGENEKKTLSKLIRMINRFNIEMNQLPLQTTSGDIHIVDVEDIEIDWECITEDDEEDEE